MSYTITDADGVQTVETQSELFDGLIMRGFSAVEALLMIGQMLLDDLDAQEPSAEIYTEGPA
jgi:hypothetical protein